MSQWIVFHVAKMLLPRPSVDSLSICRDAPECCASSQHDPPRFRIPPRHPGSPHSQFRISNLKFRQLRTGASLKKYQYFMPDPMTMNNRVQHGPQRILHSLSSSSASLRRVVSEFRSNPARLFSSAAALARVTKSKATGLNRACRSRYRSISNRINRFTRSSRHGTWRAISAKLSGICSATMERDCFNQGLSSRRNWHRARNRLPSVAVDQPQGMKSRKGRLSKKSFNMRGSTDEINRPGHTEWADLHALQELVGESNCGI